MIGMKERKNVFAKETVTVCDKCSGCCYCVFALTLWCKWKNFPYNYQIVTK